MNTGDYHFYQFLTYPVSGLRLTVGGSLHSLESNQISMILDIQVIISPAYYAVMLPVSVIIGVQTYWYCGTVLGRLADWLSGYKPLLFYLNLWDSVGSSEDFELLHYLPDFLDSGHAHHFQDVYLSGCA